MTPKRLHKELAELELKPLPGVVARPRSDSNFLAWVAFVDGPSESPYAGGRFEFEINFSADYPFRPPKLRIITPIYHPNFDSVKGNICMAMLKAEEWKPAIRVSDILSEIINMLEKPDYGDAINQDAADKLRRDPDGFRVEAAAYVAKHAMGNTNPIGS